MFKFKLRPCRLGQKLPVKQRGGETGEGEPEPRNFPVY